MISFIKGTVEDILEDQIVVECGGIGYNIFTPSSVSYNLGSEVKIYTYLSVREDAMQLYGFKTRDERRIFKLLISVSGIGPKGALGILSVITINDLELAVMADDAKLISKAPGIGPKTAKKLIIELKDKLTHEEIFTAEVNANNTTTTKDNTTDAVEALASLGYTQSEAHKAVMAAAALLDDNATTEDYLKAALKQMNL